MVQITAKLESDATIARAIVWDIGAVGNPQFVKIAEISTGTLKFDVPAGSRCAVTVIANGAAEKSATLTIKKGSKALLDPSPAKVVVDTAGEMATYSARFNVPAGED